MKFFGIKPGTRAFYCIDRPDVGSLYRHVITHTDYYYTVMDDMIIYRWYNSPTNKGICFRLKNDNGFVIVNDWTEYES